MRYANTKHSHCGVGVEPQPGGKGAVVVCDTEHRQTVTIHDRAQLQEVVSLLRHASIINGWGQIE